MTTQQLVMDRVEPSMNPAPPGPSEVKSIIFHVTDDGGLEQRLEAALSLARACSAHLECLHVTPIQAYVIPDTFGGVFTSGELMRALEADAAKLRERMERRLAVEDVTWSYREITGDVAGRIVAHAALSDLVVLGRARQEFDLGVPNIGFLGDLMSNSRTPLLILGDSAEAFNPNGPALVAWNGSYEAANALRASLGLLRLASEVQLIAFDEDKPGYFPGTRPLEYLSRHGIHAELRTGPGGKGDVAAALVTYAVENGMSFIVMGGYSHSRAGEYLFGGVTRDLLKSCPVALVMTR